MAWVQTNAEAYAGQGASSGGMFDASGMTINYGAGATVGAGVPSSWVLIAAALGVAWLMFRKH